MMNKKILLSGIAAVVCVLAVVVVYRSPTQAPIENAVTTAFVYATTGNARPTLYAYDPVSGRTKQLFSYDSSLQNAPSLFASYDPETLAIVRYGTDQKNALVSLQGKELSGTTIPKSTTFLVSHDGALVAESDFDHPESSGAYPLIVRNLTTGTTVRTESVGESGYFRPIAYSSDTKLLWMIRGIDTEGCLSNLFEMNTQTGATREPSFVREQGFCIGSIDAERNVAYAINGRDLGYLEPSRAKAIFFVDLSTQVVTSIPLHRSRLSSWRVLYSPNRTSIAYSAEDGTWLIDSDGMNERKIAEGSPLMWSSDGFLAIDETNNNGPKFGLYTMATKTYAPIVSSDGEYIEPIGWMME